MGALKARDGRVGKYKFHHYPPAMLTVWCPLAKDRVKADALSLCLQLLVKGVQIKITSTPA